MSSIRTQRTLTICGLMMKLWAIVHYFHRGQCKIFGPVLSLADSWLFYGLLCALNLSEMALISNVYLVPFSRETEKWAIF